MHEPETLSLRFKANLGQQRAQVGLVVRSRDITGPVERLLPPLLLLRVLVGAAAVIAIEADPVIVVAHDGRDATLADQRDRLIRSRAVADQVAQVVDRIRRFRVDRREHHFGCDAVAVQITEDGDAGGHLDASQLSSGSTEVHAVFAQGVFVPMWASGCRVMTTSTSNPTTPQTTNPTVSPKAWASRPMRSGPSMSPNSLNEPATPIVAPICPCWARVLTNESVFVQTVPMPIPARTATIPRATPSMNGTRMTLIPASPKPRRTVASAP